MRAATLFPLALALVACGGPRGDGGDPSLEDAGASNEDASNGARSDAAAPDASLDAGPGDALDASTRDATFGGDAFAPDARTPDATTRDAQTTDAQGADASPTSSCEEDLLAKGVRFERTAARGVVEALKVRGPINGVLFTGGTSGDPIDDPMACAFVQTLWKFAALVRARGFVRVGTLGSYCYRCCCAWSPTNTCRTLSDPEPNCGASGYSNHSWGRALDVRYLTKANGSVYDINDPRHWVVSSASGETCTRGLASQTGISRELYALACDATEQRIFGTTLTPNFNEAHRNHLHMDIGRSGVPSSWTTKSFDRFAGLDDASGAAGDDRCGGE